MEDVALGAFSVFFTQCPSFLSHQQYLQETQGKNNARTLFGIEKIPTANHIRDLLDHVEPEFLRGCYSQSLTRLMVQGHGIFSEYQDKSLGDTLLVALDGTGYFESKSISCPRCQTKVSSKSGTSFQHSCLIPAIVSPGKSVVLPLFPEFITPQDGDLKQDCEYKAARRWLARGHEELGSRAVTLLGDDLYARQGIGEAVLERGWDFILTCKPTSHKHLEETVQIQNFNGNIQKLTTSCWDGKHKITQEYRWARNVPLREKESMLVNWVEISSFDETGKPGYHNSFITSHYVEEANVAQIVAAGRARWKIENEGNNTLKNHGYHLEHNFGHGKNALAQTLLAMNLLAFLFHSILELWDSSYKEVREYLGRRRKFFEHVEALTTYFVYENFDLLIAFMLDRLRANASGKTTKKTGKKA